MMKFSHLAVIAFAAMGGWFAARFWAHGLATREVDASRKALFYQSPMHPWVKSDKPGQCTVCGMDLVPVFEGGKNFDNATDRIVMLPSGSPNVINVPIAEVKKQRLVRTLCVAGMIGEDESRHGVISAPVEGRMDGLAMNCEGQPVSRRQPIATIFSRTLLSAANDYKLALDAGGPKLDQAKRRLEQYGLVWEQIREIPQRQPDDFYFGVLSPLTGTIVKSYVNEGQYVKQGEKLFEVADFTRVWCIFTVYEQDIPLIHERQIVTVSVPSLAGESINARVGFISPNLDEGTRSARVRVVLENPDRRLKNKAFAEGIIELDAAEVLAVPRSAVLWAGNIPRVYVEITPVLYQQREVRLGRVGDALWEVLGGLKEGERVVLSGNMLIDGQAQLDSSMRNSAADSRL